MIKRIDPSEFTLAAELIRASFLTVADDLGFTEQNCPRYIGFVISAERLRTQYGWGWQILGLYVDEQLVGYASISNEGEGAYEFHNIAVLPEFRHRGYGKQLVDFCVDTVAASGGNRVNISIVEENTVLKDWYTEYGFVHTGTSKYEHLLFTVGSMVLDVSGVHRGK